MGKRNDLSTLRELKNCLSAYNRDSFNTARMLVDDWLNDLQQKRINMVEKYIIRQGDDIIVFKFNFLKMELTLGGKAKYREELEELINQYYKIDITLEMKFTQANKIRYVLKCIPAKYKAILETLKAEYGSNIERVQAHGRLL